MTSRSRRCVLQWLGRSRRFWTHTGRGWFPTLLLGTSHKGGEQSAVPRDIAACEQEPHRQRAFCGRLGFTCLLPRAHHPGQRPPLQTQRTVHGRASGGLPLTQTPRCLHGSAKGQPEQRIRESGSLTPVQAVAVAEFPRGPRLHPRAQRLHPEPSRVQPSPNPPLTAARCTCQQLGHRTLPG